MFAAPYAVAPEAVPLDTAAVPSAALPALAEVTEAEPARPLPLDIAADGQPIYAAVVKPTADGRLVLCVMSDTTGEQWLTRELADCDGSVAGLIADLTANTPAGNA